MKKIIYYVTDHGQGHATRTVALVRALAKFNFDVTIRNSNHIDFFEKSLSKIKIVSGITDVGQIIQKNGISINKKESIPQLNRWIENLDKTSQKEIEKIKKINPSLIISDISAMPFLVAEKINIPSIAISNFSWSEVLYNIVPDKLHILDNAYEKADFAIRLSLGTELKPFHNKKNVGLVCRSPTKSKKEIRKELGINDEDFCIFIPLGIYHKILGKIDKKIRIISGGAKINSSNILKINNWIEGQNLVNASDLVICKCGYGLISECLTTETPFLYLMDDFHIEQKAMSEKIYGLGLQNRISEDDLFNLDLSKLDNKDFIKPRKEKNDTETAVDIINQFVKK